MFVITYSVFIILGDLFDICFYTSECGVEIRSLRSSVCREAAGLLASRQSQPLRAILSWAIRFRVRRVRLSPWAAAARPLGQKEGERNLLLSIELRGKYFTCRTKNAAVQIALVYYADLLFATRKRDVLASEILFCLASRNHKKPTADRVENVE